MYTIESHPKFEGYLNVTELYNVLKAGGVVHPNQIDINPNCIKWVKEISADVFDDDECPSVLLQVLQEHVEGGYDYTIGELTEFNLDANLYLYLGY